MQQVVERVLKALMGGSRPRRAGAAEEQELIVVAHDLSPADMILFKQHRFGGFVTDLGGVTSHTAIVARSLDIPAIVGLHHARHMIREDETLIVDGTQGVLIVNPDPLVLAEYRCAQIAARPRARRSCKRLKYDAGGDARRHADRAATPTSSCRRTCRRCSTAARTGVGLFRTEFLFMNRDDLPDEDEQFEAYREVARGDGGPAGDASARSTSAPTRRSTATARATMPNPALGLRAIRFCLAEPQMFLTQLRAILRASHYGKVRILIPMLAHAHEIDQTLSLIAPGEAAARREGAALRRARSRSAA